MVGTRHAVSDNKSKSGLGMPSPYIPERNLRAKQNSRKERKGRRDFADYYRSPFTSHRSPTTVRHKTENPQTLAITGVPADDVLLQNR